MTNNKKNKKKANAVLPTVSILTITQKKRQDTIKLCAEHIDNQGLFVGNHHYPQNEALLALSAL